jgi:hypothetical protein
MSSPSPVFHLRPTAATVLDTICFLSHTHQAPTLTNIAAELRCTKSVAFNLLSQLAAEGAVRIESGEGEHVYRIKGVCCE